jgi:hypothetical protein
MWSWLIELISNIVDITGNPLADTIIFAVIGFISGSIAFGLVGIIFDFSKNRNSKTMSEIHWGLRFVIFGVLTYIFVKIAQFLRWLFAPPALYYIIGFTSLIVGVVVLWLIFKKTAAKTAKEETRIVENKEKNIEENNVKKLDKYDEHKCPYCGGLLVERIGPYGRFIGCNNYPKCKYTKNE